MSLKCVRNLVISVCAFSLFATSAQASTFTLTPSTSGLTFTIENQGLAATDLYLADGVNDTFQLLLTLTTTTDYVNAGAGADLLAAFSVDLGASALQGATLVTGPAGLAWTLFADDKVAGNSAKCGGSNLGGLCVEETASNGGNLVLDASGVYSWLFLVDLGATGFGDATTLDVGIGTLKKTGPNYAFQGSSVVSGLTGSLALPPPREEEDPITDPAIPAPEPGSLVLLGSGLVFAASRMRRGKR